MSEAVDMDMRKVVWENVAGFMTLRWGRENLNKLAKAAGIGAATVARLKTQETHTGVDVLEKIAHVFEVQVWQLLVPGMDPKNPPVLKVGGRTELEFYKALESIRKQVDELESKLDVDEKPFRDPGKQNDH